MPRFEVDVLTTSTITYEVVAKDEAEARAKWAAKGFEISEFVEEETVMDVRPEDERFEEDE